MFDVITIGGATRDVFFKTSEGKILDGPRPNQKFLAFEYGAKIVPEETHFDYGGGGANTAVSFARLGLKVATTLNIGKEGTGSLINEKLKKEGVNISLISRDPKLHTALSIIVSLKGDHSMFLYRGANNNLNIKNWDKLKDTKWIYLTSLTGDSSLLVSEITSFIKRNKINLAFNPGSVQLDEGYKALKPTLETTKVLILNRRESAELLLSQNPKANIVDEKIMLETLSEMGPEIVVMTEGLEGSYVYADSLAYHEKCYSVKTVDSTGAGDSFGSTFVAGQILGISIQESLKMAAINAASVVERIGAQYGLLKIDELRGRL